jgi:hypothetical protein
MFSSGAIDLALGLIVIFLIFSLVVSGINEGITRILASRSRQLWKSLRTLLDGPTGKGDQRPLKEGQGDTSFTSQLYENPIIKQFEKAVHDSHTRLSHIPGNAFAQGLIDVLVPNGDGHTTVEEVRRKIKELNPPFEKPLLAIASEAGTNSISSGRASASGSTAGWSPSLPLIGGRRSGSCSRWVSSLRSF